jgi:integrase
VNRNTSHNKVPKLRRQARKPYDRGFVVIDGTRHYLGRYGTDECTQRYHRLIHTWLANGRALDPPERAVKIVELIRDYWRHAKRHYRSPNGNVTSSRNRVRTAARKLKALYGDTPASEFGPTALRAVRQAWIESGLARSTINEYTDEIKRLFRWGVSQELVPSSVYESLRCVDGLRRGRSNARETNPIGPVPPSNIKAIRQFVSRQVWAIAQLQLLTGGRGDEIARLRPVDIDTTGDVWFATLDDHKTAYRGRPRTLYLGPRAQEVIRSFLNRPVTNCLFSAREARQERAAKAPTHRRPDQRPSPRQTDRVVRDHYDRNSYRRAIHRACDRAGVPHWSPHQLRHNAGTHIRKEFGLEAAQVILGHAHADVTQVYAEVDHAKAIEIVRQVG